MRIKNNHNDLHLKLKNVFSAAAQVFRFGKAIRRRLCVTMIRIYINIMY